MSSINTRHVTHNIQHEILLLFCFKYFVLRTTCYMLYATCYMRYSKAPEIKITIEKLVQELAYTHIDTTRVHCIRSFDVKTRAYARIWGMSKLFFEVAGIKANYIIEVVAKRFDKLSEREKIKTLIHELMHIPKTFSGALLSHRGPHHAINDREVEKVIAKMKNEQG